MGSLLWPLSTDNAYRFRFVDERAVGRIIRDFATIGEACAWLEAVGASFVGGWFWLDGRDDGGRPVRLRADVFTTAGADRRDVYRWHPAQVIEWFLPQFFGEVRDVSGNPRCKRAWAEVQANAREAAGVDACETAGGV